MKILTNEEWAQQREASIKTYKDAMELLTLITDGGKAVDIYADAECTRFWEEKWIKNIRAFKHIPGEKSKFQMVYSEVGDGHWCNAGGITVYGKREFLVITEGNEDDLRTPLTTLVMSGGFIDHKAMATALKDTPKKSRDQVKELLVMERNYHRDMWFGTEKAWLNLNGVDYGGYNNYRQITDMLKPIRDSLALTTKRLEECLRR